MATQRTPSKDADFTDPPNVSITKDSIVPRSQDDEILSWKGVVITIFFTLVLLVCCCPGTNIRIGSI